MAPAGGADLALLNSTSSTSFCLGAFSYLLTTQKVKECQTLTIIYGTRLSVFTIILFFSNLIRTSDFA